MGCRRLFALIYHSPSDSMVRAVVDPAPANDKPTRSGEAQPERIATNDPEEIAAFFRKHISG